MNYFSPHLLDGSVTTAKLADNAVTRSKLIDSAIGTAELGPLSVTEAKIATATIVRAKLETATESLAGSITGNDTVHITMFSYGFWPMLHVIDVEAVRLTGHETDGISPDLPRFALDNTTGAPKTYDVDYRYIVG